MQNYTHEEPCNESHSKGLYYPVYDKGQQKRLEVCLNVQNLLKIYFQHDGIHHNKKNNCYRYGNICNLNSPKGICKAWINIAYYGSSTMQTATQIERYLLKKSSSLSSSNSIFSLSRAIYSPVLIFPLLSCLQELEVQVLLFAGVLSLPYFQAAVP